MKTVVQHETLGEIVYEESFWTVRKSLTIGGRPLMMIKRGAYVLQNADGTQTNVLIKGNFLSGVKLEINNEIVIISQTKWYEWVLSIIIFAWNMVWGNSVALCEIVPVIGGAIGGLICALFMMINLALMRKTKNVGLKLLIWVAMLGASFLCCYLAALAFLSMVA